MKDAKRNGECIGAYLHCQLCVEEWMANPEIKSKQSPQQYSRIQAGWTKEGLQVWCFRHNANVIHIDFEGQQYHADMTRKATTLEKSLK